MPHPRTPFPPLSLRNKLLLFAASLVLVPGIVLVLIAERSGRDSLQKVIGRELAREAGHTASRLATVLRTEREILASFARQDLMRDVRVFDIDKRVSLALATLRDGSESRVDYLVVTRDREVVAASDPHRIGVLPVWLEGEWATANGKDHLWGPLPLPGGPAVALLMSAAIPDPDDEGRLLGTLVGIYDWEALSAVTEAVRNALAEHDVDVLVTRSDGSVIGGARSSAPRAATRADLSAVARSPHAQPDYSVDETAGLIIGRASLGADLPDWELLVVEPRVHALAPARELGTRLLVTMGLAVVAALVLATWAARRVVGPLSDLTRAIRGLPHGDSGSLRVPVRTEDEVGTLAVAFNEMASELDRTQRELVEAEQFAFVGELAAGVAHEIRTSLGVLGSSSQILERSMPAGASAETGELAQMIHAEVDRLSGVVNDLLTLDRVKPLNLETVLLSEPVFQAVDFVRPQAGEKGITIRRFAPPHEPVVPCDPELVYQMAVNLLVNATQALERGGSIEARVLGAWQEQGGFEVRDDGPGVPAALRERIFQPFVTARDGGIGLGLTFVKRVVHDHHGVVSLESASGHGTCIRIRLPLEAAIR